MILITGGAGYLGSHTAVALLKAGHEVIILDNFSNSHHVTISKIERLSGKDLAFIEGDCRKKDVLDRVFSEYEVEAVFHMAASKSVVESNASPLEYADNNITSTINLLKACSKKPVKQFIFSSSAAVYNPANNNNLDEDTPIDIKKSSYAFNKYACERLLLDFSAVNPATNCYILRYFNPIGANPSGLLPENPKSDTVNLLPAIHQVALGRAPELVIHGNDYNTHDGTCVRDYVHISDIAKAHVAVLAYQSAGKPLVLNLGSGQGLSVLDIVQAFEKVNGCKIPYRFGPPRSVDAPYLVSDISRAKRCIHWSPKLTYTEALKDGWFAARQLT